MSRYLQVPVTSVQDIGYKPPIEWWDAELQRKNKAAEETAAGMDVVNATTFQYLDVDKEASQQQLSSWKQKEEELANLYMQDPEKAAVELAKTKRQLTRELSTPGELAYEAQMRFSNLQAKQKQVDALKDKTPIKQWYNIDRELKNLDPLKQGEDGKWSGNSFSSFEDLPDIDAKLLDELKNLNSDFAEGIEWSPSLDQNGNPAGYSFIIKDGYKNLSEAKVKGAVQAILQKPEYSRTLQIRQMYEDELASSDYDSPEEYQADYLSKKHDQYIEYAGQLKHQLKGKLTKDERDLINKELEQLKSIETELLSDDPKVKQSRFDQERQNEIVSRYTNSNQKLFSYSEVYKDVQALKDETATLQAAKQEVLNNRKTAFPTTKTNEELAKTADIVSESNNKQQEIINTSNIQIRKIESNLKESLGLYPEPILNADGTELLDDNDLPVMNFKLPVQQVMQDVTKIMNNPTDPNQVKQEVETYLKNNNAKGFSTVANTDPKDGLTWEQFQTYAKDYTTTNQSISENKALIANKEAIINSTRKAAYTEDSDWDPLLDIYNQKVPHSGFSNAPPLNDKAIELLDDYFNIKKDTEFLEFFKANPVITANKLQELNEALVNSGKAKPLTANWDQFGVGPTLTDRLVTISNEINKIAIKNLPQDFNLSNMIIASNPFEKTFVDNYNKRMKAAFEDSAGLLANVYTTTSVSAEEYLTKLGLAGEKGILWSSIELSPVVLPSTGKPSVGLSYIEKGTDGQGGTRNYIELVLSDPELIALNQEFATEMIETGEKEEAEKRPTNPKFKSNEKQWGLAMLGHSQFGQKMQDSYWSNLAPGIKIEIGTVNSGNGDTPIFISHDENGWWDIEQEVLVNNKPTKVSIYKGDNLAALEKTTDKGELMAQLGQIAWSAANPTSGVEYSSLEEAVAATPVTQDLPDFSSYVDSPTAKVFTDEIIANNYTYTYGAKGEKDSIDCSGAVCKVLKQFGIDLGNPSLKNSAQDIHNKSVAVDETEAQDGDLITFKTEGEKIDHIGLIIIDQNTGERFIAESSKSFNKGKIVPFQQRIDFLRQNTEKEGHTFEYSIRRLK